jgi:hypothetical protein
MATHGISDDVAWDGKSIPSPQILKPTQSDLYAEDRAVVRMNDRLWHNLSDFPIFKTTKPMRMNDVEVAYPLQIPSVHGKRGVNPARRIDPGRLHQLYLIASSCLRFGDTANPILQAA